jgi:probable F420-dependent oxidoreductase
MDLRNVGVWYSFDTMSGSEAAQAAKRIEELGYSAIWVPDEVGRNPFALAGWFLANTSKINIATGIVNLYNVIPSVMRACQRTLAEISEGRFILGVGVSHKVVTDMRGIDYGSPLTTMRNYLEGIDRAIDGYQLPGIETIETPTVIAALGPKMLALAAQKCDGAHTFFVSPEHTASAREILGPDKWLCVEQKVVLEPDPVKAREAARPMVTGYSQLPNYRNNWLRYGLTEADFADGASDRLIDASVAWGNEEAIRKRIEEHYAAGASHVCIRPISPNGDKSKLDWNVLKALAPAKQ